MEWGSFEVTSTIAARLGPVLLDTHTVFCQTVAIWYMPSLGLAAATSTLVIPYHFCTMTAICLILAVGPVFTECELMRQIGNSLGAGLALDARAYAWIALGLIFFYGCFNAGVFELLLRQYVPEAQTLTHVFRA